MKNKKQSGVALVTVLLVAAVTIALAYGALTVSLNTLQGSKASESSVQARLNAESGLDATFVYLEREFENENQNPFSSPTSSTPIPSVISGGGISIDRETWFNLHDNLSHQTDSDGNRIYEVIVDGLGLNRGLYTTEASVYYNPGDSGGTDPNIITTPTNLEQFLYRGITSCSGPSFSTGGFILGNGNFIFGDPDTIHTIGSWNSGVTGNLFSPGSVTLSDGAKIDGNIYVNGDLTLNGQPEVKGDVYVSGKLTLKVGSKITGTVYSNGPVSVSGWGSNITGNIHTPATVSVSEQSKIVGDLFVRDPTAVTGINIHGTIQLFDKDVLATSEPMFDIFNLRQINLDVCNGAPDIKKAISDLQSVIPSSGIVIKTDNENTRRWEISPVKVQAGATDWEVISKTYAVEPAIVQFLGNQLQVIRVASIDSEDEAEINISGGHIALLVDGPVNFKALKGLTIENGSSLTIITPSKITFAPGVGNSAWNTISDERRPTLTLMTSHQSTNSNDYGFNMTGGDKILNALVYAPDSIVNLAADNEIIGAVLAKSIKFSGGAASLIHYDSELLTLLEEQMLEDKEGLVIVKRR